MKLSLQLLVTDQAAPKLRELIRTLDPKEAAEFFDELAGEFEVLTREHITGASASRHKTAARLGANPTKYLERAAQTVEARGQRGRVSLEVAGEIFKRAFGPVTVRAEQAKMLTLPWRAEAYGRRAGDFENLFIYKSGRGQVFLARRAGRAIELMFLLKKSVLLPQDRGLLPSEEAYLAAAEKVAVAHVEKMLAALASD